MANSRTSDTDVGLTLERFYVPARTRLTAEPLAGRLHQLRRAGEARLTFLKLAA